MVHGCMVYTERAETTAVSRGTSHVTTKQRCKYTNSVGIQNALLIDFCCLTSTEGLCKRATVSDSHSFRIACDKSAVSLLESGDLLHTKAINNNNNKVAVESTNVSQRPDCGHFTDEGEEGEGKA